jgi:hypothetical protein
LQIECYYLMQQDLIKARRAQISQLGTIQILISLNENTRNISLP